MLALLWACSGLLRGPGGNASAWYRYRRAGDGVHADFGDPAPVGDVPADLVAAHNVVRVRAGLAAVAPSAALAARAQEVVDATLARPGCEIFHSSASSRMDGRGGDFFYVGENLYKVDGAAPTGYGVADAWYAELADYRYGTVGSSCTKKCLGRERPCMTGHFTQMLWARTEEVGCALGTCPGQDDVHVVVCQYGPGGNIVGEEPFAPAHAGALGLHPGQCEDGHVLLAAGDGGAPAVYVVLGAVASVVGLGATIGWL